MDVTSRVEIEFLDLSDLDTNSKNQISAILRFDTASAILKLPWDSKEVEYGNPEEVDMHETQKMCQNYSMEDMMKHENITNSSSSVLVPYQYGAYHLFDGYLCVDPSFQYLQNIQYMPTPMYPASEHPEQVPPPRDNSRRGRGKIHHKRDNFNPAMNHTNEMQIGYMNEHGHPLPMAYSSHPVYQIPDLTAAATGPRIYYNPSQPTYMQQQNRNIANTNYPLFQSSPTNVKCNRQGFAQMNGDVGRKSVAYKMHEKRTHHVNMSKPSIRQFNDKENIGLPVIVNNSNMDPSVNNNNENPDVDVNAGTKSPINIKTEHVSETIAVASESAVADSNINSCDEIQQNGGNNKEGENEFKPHTTPLLKINDVREEEVKPEIESTQPEVIVQTKRSWAETVGNGPSKTGTRTATSKPVVRVSPQVSDDQNQTSYFDKCNAQTAPKNKQWGRSKNVETPPSTLPLTQNEFLPHIDDPNVYRMGEYFLTYQMDTQTVSLVPRGLTNRSNYCYINSILQALLACPPFFNLLKALPHSQHQSRNSRSPLIDNMIKFANEFTPLADGGRLARANRSQKRNEDSVVDIQPGLPFEPSYVYTMMKNTSSAGVFSVEGRQEDAEEFLSCLLNGISDEMLELMKLANNNEHKSVNTDANSNLSAGGEEWKVMGHRNKGSITRCTDFGKTPLSEIFRGQLRSRVWRQTDQNSDYVQPFFTLQLDIEKAESVTDALEILVGKDPLEGMTCSKTNQQVMAWKQVTLEQLPVILILHLKWFDYKPDGCSKILKEIKFPIDLKIDAKFLTAGKAKNNSKSRQYKLFAVTYHDGKEATKGHYITDAFHVGYGGWVRYDDSSLKCVSESNVLNPQPPRVPYLLYYRRCDTIGNNNNPPNNKVR